MSFSSTSSRDCARDSQLSYCLRRATGAGEHDEEEKRKQDKWFPAINVAQFGRDDQEAYEHMKSPFPLMDSRNAVPVYVSK